MDAETIKKIIDSCKPLKTPKSPNETRKEKWKSWLEFEESGSVKMVKE